MNAVIDALRHAEPLLLLALVLMAGSLFGTMARRVRLPAITGQIVGGIVIGRAGFDLFSQESIQGQSR